MEISGPSGSTVEETGPNNEHQTIARQDDCRDVQITVLLPDRQGLVLNLPLVVSSVAMVSGTFPLIRNVDVNLAPRP